MEIRPLGLVLVLLAHDLPLKDVCGHFTNSLHRASMRFRLLILLWGRTSGRSACVSEPLPTRFREHPYTSARGYGGGLGSFRLHLHALIPMATSEVTPCDGVVTLGCWGTPGE